MLNDPLKTGYKLPKRKLYLEKDFRNWAFIRAYSAAGRLGEIARRFGYMAKGGKNGAIRDMWLGRKPIPLHHLRKLAALAELDEREFSNHIVDAKMNEVQNDWIDVKQLFDEHLAVTYSKFQSLLSLSKLMEKTEMV